METARPEPVTTRDAAGRRAALAISAQPRAALALSGILLLSALLNCVGLARDGFANLYYAAAVRSALDSWHNLFFSAFDPGGFAATDKPPLGFAVQTLSAKLLGFNPIALALPQALAGVAAVYVLYRLVRRGFGAGAGLIAALALTLTPIAVATARNNTIDSQLVLVVLLAAWSTLRAAEAGRLRWLLLAGALLGAGFLIKLSEALLIVPACAVAYLACAPESLRARLLKLTLAGAVVAATGGAWVAAIDATPRTQRPYIISSSDDSALSVIVGMNGLGRLVSGAAASHAAFAQPVAGVPTVAFPAISAGGTKGEVGPPGLLRLLGRPLAGQIGWLLLLALVGCSFAAWQRWRERGAVEQRADDRQLGVLLLLGVWLVSGAVFFSFASFVHRYYLTMLAPAVAGGAALGLVTLWRRFREHGRGWPQAALPLALLLSAEAGALILLPYSGYRLLLLALIALCGLPAVVLLLARYPARRPGPAPARRVQTALGALACATLLLGPLLWSLSPLLTTEAAELPFAGPDLARVSHSAFTPNGYPRNADPGLIAFLRTNHGGERYWLGTFTSVTSAPVVLALNRPVRTLGGYLGGDPTTDAADEQALVREGQIRFFLLPNIDGIAPAGDEGVSVGVAAAVDWVRQSCPAVPDAAWRTRADPPANPLIAPYFSLVSGGKLYDCARAR